MLVKKFELEKEELTKETIALKFQTEMLIKENKNVKASLGRDLLDLILFAPTGA